MSSIKILVVGPQRSGKSTITNILGELTENITEFYRPTVACRIVECERDPPPAMASFGKINLEFWDVSGDFKYEKCWGPIQKEAQGIIFVYDPNVPEGEALMNQFVQMFPKAMQLQPKFCMVFINHHNSNGAIPQVSLPKCMDSLDKHHGTCEDPNGIFQGF